MATWLLIMLVAAWCAAHWVARCVATCGPVQVPNGRSSHVNPTPQSGGLGVVLGVGLALSLLMIARPADALTPEDLIAVAGGVIMLSLLAGMGLIDDIWEVSPRIKFALLIAISCGLAVTGGVVDAFPVTTSVSLNLPFVFGLLGSALWIFTAANASNFMDGANGLLAGVMAIAFGVLGLCALFAGANTAVLLSVAGLGASLGFSPLNARTNAQVFLGDVGALFLGGLFAFTALIYAKAAPSGAIYLCPLFVAPLLIDVLLTQWIRARRGASLLEPHREHAYQRWLRSGVRHVTVSRRVWLQTAACGVIALIANISLSALGPLVGLAALVLGMGVCSATFFTAPKLDDGIVRAPTPTPVRRHAPAFRSGLPKIQYVRSATKSASSISADR